MSLRIHGEGPTLRWPILICAFRGWNDGKQTSRAAGDLARAWDATQFRNLDPEEFFDLR